MPERFEIYIVYKRRYINTLSLLLCKNAGFGISLRHHNNAGGLLTVAAENVSDLLAMFCVLESCVGLSFFTG